MKIKMVNTIKENNLIESNDNIIVGVSGGPDSIALLYLLYEYSNDVDFNIHIAHINHGTRGADSDGDEEFVKNICTKLDIPFYSKKVDMNRYAKENKLSPEEAGREIRYDFFKKIISEVSNGKVAVAHNKNDQAETLLMRFLRGSGIDGLKGMEYKNKYIIRPLLDITRSEIEEYLDENNINARIDKSNYSTIYLRNKIRLDLMPYIMNELNSNIINTLHRTSKVMKDDSEFLKIKTLEKYNDVIKDERNNKVIFDTKCFNKLHKAIKYRIIRMGIEKVKGNLKNIDEKHIKIAIEHINKKMTGKYVTLCKDIRVINSYDEFSVEKEHKLNKDIAFKYIVKLNEKKYLEKLDSNIIIEVKDIRDLEEINKNQYIKSIDYDKVKGNLFIRNRKDGDRFIPLGMKGNKKLKDYFIDNKVEREKRNTIPILCDEENIIWIVGMRLSELYKVDKNTKRILMLKYMPGRKDYE